MKTMSNLIETLESRTLLSASAAVITLRADEVAAKADLVALDKTGVAVKKSLKVDLKTESTAIARAQQKSFSSVFSALIRGDTKALSHTGSKVNSDANKLESAEAALARKPGNTSLSAKVAVDKTALTADAASGLASIHSANNGDAVLTSLGNIETDGGAAGTDATNAVTILSTNASAFSTAATTAFSTDVSAIVGT
jgi:hypothetical protein